VLNVVNATYNQYWNGSTPLSGTDWPSQLGFGNTGAKNFPQINFGSAVNGYSETFIGNTWQGNWIAGNYIYGDDLTWIKGRHTISFGGNFRAMQINSHSVREFLTSTSTRTPRVRLTPPMQARLGLDLPASCWET
jgi:hypothetical protein